MTMIFVIFTINIELTPFYGIFRCDVGNKIFSLFPWIIWTYFDSYKNGCNRWYILISCITFSTINYDSRLFVGNFAPFFFILLKDKSVIAYQEFLYCLQKVNIVKPVCAMVDFKKALMSSWLGLNDKIENFGFFLCE